MPEDARNPERLKSERIQAGILKVPAWALDGDTIVRTYKLPSFRAALAFVQFVGELAEARDHHPDIDIRYNRVKLTLTTHSAGGLTERDFDLAELIESR
ncbi:MAG: 4a-hydroxytetrahydrobiopterin dehydratase [Acidobacteriota bacterium]|nr:4a-hydroxytetrahydrobiopterin dehydratase [Acidobacteriota bacterium]